MSGSWFDENFNDFSEEFFDDICDIKYYDFCLEDVEPNEAGEDWEAKFQNLEPPPLNVLTSFSSGLCFENSSNAVKMKRSSLVSCDEPLQLKQWPSGSNLSKTVTPLLYDSSEGKYSHTLQTCSPVSVLESSSSSCSAENPVPRGAKFVIPVKRPRSKRCCNRWHKFPPIFFPRASKRYHHLTASEIDAENYAGELRLNSAKKKQNKKKNLTQLSSEVDIAEPSSEPGGARKCTHCQVTKTPQWREGPMGPKTLCNACGVRYRSGRLFPEYRPAASPTFVPLVHSNSHRKVLEMRKKAGQVTVGPVMNPSISSAAEDSFDSCLLG